MLSVLLFFFWRKFICPCAHKAGPHENFVKGVDKTGRGFEYVRNNFPNMSDAKVKEDIFIGSQIRELMQDKQFDEDPNETERNAWLSSKKICKDFLGNHKAANYQDVAQDLLTSYKAMQYESENPLYGITPGFFSQEISAKLVTNMVKDFTKTLWLWKKQCQGKWTSSVLADYCWTLKRDVPDAKYRQKSYASTF